MDIFENLENLNVSEECFDSIMDIVEELISESNRARKYGQKNLTNDPSTVDIVGTKALKDSTQMNPERSSINLINKGRSVDPGEIPPEGVHDMRFNTLDDPDTKKAFKNKEAIQGAIKSLKQADSSTARKSLRNLKDVAREISRRKNPDENVDVLSKNSSYGGFKPNAPKDNYKNVMNSLKSNYGYRRLEKETKRENK